MRDTTQRIASKIVVNAVIHHHHLNYSWLVDYFDSKGLAPTTRSRNRSLPVPLLLPGRVRVEPTRIRATLRVPEMTLRALALGLLALLALRPRALGSREPLRVEPALALLLHSAAALRALSAALAHTNAPGDVLHPDVAAVRLVCVLRGARCCTLTEPARGPARRRGRLAEAHEALHALRARAVKALMLAVFARRQARADVLADRVLVLRMVRLVTA